MIYNFPHHNITIVDPVITVQSVNDNFIDKTCSVVVLLDSNGNKYLVTLTGFNYEVTWYDSDIVNWVNQEMVKFEVI